MQPDYDLDKQVECFNGEKWLKLPNLIKGRYRHAICVFEDFQERSWIYCLAGFVVAEDRTQKFCNYTERLQVPLKFEDLTEDWFSNKEWENLVFAETMNNFHTGCDYVAC